MKLKFFPIHLPKKTAGNRGKKYKNLKILKWKELAAILPKPYISSNRINLSCPGNLQRGLILIT